MGSRLLSAWRRSSRLQQRAWSGQHKGSRVVIAMPGQDGYDPMGGNPQAGIEVGDTLIFVVDVVDVQLAGPKGTWCSPRQDSLP